MPHGEPIRFSCVLGTGVLLGADAPRLGHDAHLLRSEAEQRALVYELLAHPENAPSIRDALGLGLDAGRAEIGDALLAALTWGVVRCVRFANQGGQMEMPTATDLAELADPFVDEEPKPTTGWIEIVLTEYDGAPVSDEAYRILTPDGDDLRGQLDDDGATHHDDVARLTCRVSFPKIDKGDWTVHPGPPEPEPPFVDVIVTDEDDTPIGDADWELEFPGGVTETGVTDASGRIFLPNVELASVCRLVVTRKVA